MPDKLILDKERDRRFMTWIAAIVVTLMYFYEFPMYWLLRAAVRLLPRYAEANRDPSAWTPPTLGAMDLGLMVLILLSVAYVYIRPRHYLRRNGDDAAPVYGLYRNARHERDVPGKELSELEIYRDCRKDRTFDRVSRSWRESNRPHLVVRAAGDPDIVLYDRRESLFRRHRGIAGKMESFFGEVHWKDREGIFSGRVSADTVAEEQRKEARREKADDYLSRRSRRQPKVRTAWGARIFFILAFAGFGLGFWMLGGYRVVGWVFLGISLIILVDMVLALMGFGQQPAKKSKPGKN